MKLQVEWSDDGEVHRYCLSCRCETVERVIVDGRTYYDCTSCGRRAERSLVIDPKVRWWVDESGEYWHESAGVFVRRDDGRFLCFDRIIFPYQVTVPAGTSTPPPPCWRKASSCGG